MSEAIYVYRNTEPEQPVTINQVADHCKVCVRTIRRWMTKGFPSHRMPGGHTLFFLSEVNDYIRGSKLTIS